MRIDCPSCNAAYDVPNERLAPGRAVKCARCASSWTPVPLETAAEPVVAAREPDPVPVPDPIPEAVPDAVVPESVPVEAPARHEVLPAEAPPPTVAVPRRGRPMLVVAWVVSIGVIVASGWIAIDRRAAIMQAWPPSVRGYAALGLVAGAR